MRKFAGALWKNTSHSGSKCKAHNQAAGITLSFSPSQGGVAVYWRDITAEKQAQDQLEELVAMLQQADENRNNFINILSHELRNPLAAITIGLTLLKNAEPGSEQAGKAIGIMERQTKQLSRLVDDLLDVTRISQNKIDLQKERVDLNEIVRHNRYRLPSPVYG